MNKNKRIRRDNIAESVKQYYRDHAIQPNTEVIDNVNKSAEDMARSRDRAILLCFLKQKEQNNGKYVILLWQETKVEEEEPEKIYIRVNSYLTAYATVEEAKKAADVIRPQRMNIYAFGKLTDEDIAALKSRLGVE